MTGSRRQLVRGMEPDREPQFTAHRSRPYSRPTTFLDSLPSHLRLSLRWLPRLLVSRRRRAIFLEALSFCRSLPVLMDQPLPAALQQVDDNPPHLALTVTEQRALRELADLAALIDRRSPLGICLRRSLVRYHLLRGAGLPLTIHLGARLDGPSTQRQIAGHAWLTYNGHPYHEPSENWRGFTIMLSWPEAGNRYSVTGNQ